MMIAFLISLLAAYLLPATPAATTCGHWLDTATARDRVGWVEINCESLPCPCLAPGAGGQAPPTRAPATPAPSQPNATPTCTKPAGVQPISFSKTKYPKIRRHFRAALSPGWPRTLVLNRRGAVARRERLLRDIPTRAGFDRDEYPPAVGRGRGKGLERGRNPRGWKADVRYVPSAENRSHGSVLGIKLRRFCDGTRFRYVFY